jgi:glycosyltransferase involved in cell wall biosynthesis
MPVYNEQASVANAVKQALDVRYPCEVELVVVDDGSRDGTGEVLTGLDDPRLHVFSHPRNRGKGAAIQTAAERATGDYMVILDADLEYDPQDIPRLLEPVLDGRATIVYGSRSFGSHSAYSFWYVLGNHTGQHDLQLVHFGPGDLLQADATISVQGAEDPVSRIRHGSGDYGQTATSAGPSVRGTDLVPRPYPRGGQEDHVA